MEFPFKEMTCVVCGKIFIPAIEHIYNETRGGRVKHICSYNCKCEFNRKHPRGEVGRRKKK